MKIKVENNGIRIRSDYQFLAGSIILFLFSIFLIEQLVAFFWNMEYVFEDFLSLIVLFVFLCFFMGSGILSFLHLSKVIMITEKGVCCNSIFKRTFLKWDDIEDWGLSYCGQTKNENTYYLYFSKKYLKEKNDERKKVKGVKTKIIVLESEYDKVVEKIVAYCKKYTGIEPFIPVKKNSHFLIFLKLDELL